MWITAAHVFANNPIGPGENYAIVIREGDLLAVREASDIRLSNRFDMAAFAAASLASVPIRLAQSEPALNADLLSYEYSGTRFIRQPDGKLNVHFEPNSHKGHTVRRYISDYPERFPTPSCLVSFPALQGASGAPLLTFAAPSHEFAIAGMLVANLEAELLPAQVVRIEDEKGRLEEIKYFLPHGKAISQAGLVASLNELRVVYEMAEL